MLADKTVDKLAAVKAGSKVEWMVEMLAEK